MYISLRDRPASRTGPRSDRPRGRRVAPAVVTLGFVSLLTDISSESVAAILPLYLTAVVGLSPVAYGFIDGLYQGVSALVRLAGGWVADRTDRPKWVAFTGYALSAVARVFLLFAAGVASIGAVVATDRIGKGIRTAPRDAMISTVTPTADLGRAFGVHRSLDTVGAALGPLIAFAVLAVIPDGYLTVMVISLAFAILGVALLGLLGPDVRVRPLRPRRCPRPDGSTSGADPAMDEDAPVCLSGAGELLACRRCGTPMSKPGGFHWRDLADHRLRPLLAIVGTLGLLTVGDGFVYLTLLDQGGFAATWFPMLYVGTNIAYLSLAVPIGRLADRVGRAKVLVLGHLALVAAYVAATLPAGGAAAGVLATLLLLGAFYAATDGVTAALAGRLVPVQARTSGIAAAQTVVAVARMIATAGFGVLWMLIGPASAMLLVASLLVVAVTACFTLVPRLDRAVVTA